MPQDGRVLATSAAVIAGLTYNFLPFMVLPLFTALERLDQRLLRPARTCMRQPRRRSGGITLPLTMPGIIAGILLTFIPAAGDYVNATFLGGTNQAMIGNVIQSKYLVVNDYPDGGALLHADGDHPRRTPVLHKVRRFGSVDGRRGGDTMKAWRWTKDHMVLFVGLLALAYMLIPILVIAVFSFNNPEGRYNFEWVGFTTEYWGKPFAITELTDALLVSIRLAFFTAIGATILGTLIAIALVRYQFFGRRAANLLIVIPMATPEVVIGASLLSMFLIYGAKLGFGTLLIAHIMFSISFVVIVVRSRLIGFDRRLEEAAADLGANAFTTFAR